MLCCLTFRLDRIVPDDFPRDFSIGADAHRVEQAVFILRCLHVYTVANFKAFRLGGLLRQFNREQARVVGFEIQGLCVHGTDDTSVCAHRWRRRLFFRSLPGTAPRELRQ